MPQSSTWKTVEKRLCQVFSPVATKMHAANGIHSRPQVANETLYVLQTIPIVMAIQGQGAQVGKPV